MKFDLPFHEGELQAQRLAEESFAAEQNGRVIEDEIPGGALAFIARQSFAVIGSSNMEGRLWSSILLGEPGFMFAPDRRTVRYNLNKVISSAHDPLWRNLEINSKVGALVIDLSTRRRLRMNGDLVKINDSSLELSVTESFPGCPKFIQRRHLVLETSVPESRVRKAADGEKLGESQKAIIAQSDTFFIASAHATRGLDVSHRGGKPGFVAILNNATLRIPDYPGNGMFQTFGNLLTNPKAGLTFADFERNQVIQLTGTAAIEWNAPEFAEETGGTGRFWEFTVEKWIQTDLANGIRWEFLDFSPYNPK